MKMSMKIFYFQNPKPKMLTNYVYVFDDLVLRMYHVVRRMIALVG